MKEKGTDPETPGPGSVSRHLPHDPRLCYAMWVLRQMPSGDDLYRQRLAARRFSYRPKVSVLTPVFNTPPDILRRMLSCVRLQTYENWEHCLIDDGSSERWIADMIQRLASRDPRIRFERLSTNGGIVAGSNAALALASGEFVTMLDHDDEIDPQALAEVVRRLNEDPATDMFYSDLDLIWSDGARRDPLFFPDWSPELLLSIPYLTHLTVFRASLVRQVGGFRPGYDGAQDYDLALRITETTDRIVHIPRILYHWRTWAQSVAHNPAAKPYAYVSGKRAINDYLHRNGIAARRDDGPGLGYHSIRFDIVGDPLVSIVIQPTNAHPSISQLALQVQQLTRRTDYRRYEIVLALPSELAARWVADVSIRNLRVVPYEGLCDGRFAMSMGGLHASGEHILFVDEHLEIVTTEWVTSLLEFSQQQSIGAVGGTIRDSDGLLWHAGIVIPSGVPYLVRNEETYQVPMNYSAVTGACLMTRKSVFIEVGGLHDPSSVGYSDVDYCLRVRRKGYRVVRTPHAQLRWTTAPDAYLREDGLSAFQQVWGAETQRDPYYNPNLSNDGKFRLELD